MELHDRSVRYMQKHTSAFKRARKGALTSNSVAILNFSMSCKVPKPVCCSGVDCMILTRLEERVSICKLQKE